MNLSTSLNTPRYFRSDSHLGKATLWMGRTRPRSSLSFLPGVLLAFAGVSFSDCCFADDSVERAKLEGAVQYVERFLKEDADPRKGDGLRDMPASVPADFPIDDCWLTTLVRSIRQMGEATFEDDSHRIARVPVVAEVVLFYNAGAGGGPSEQSSEASIPGCSFEYERYNFRSNQFEHLPNFRNQTFNQSLIEWGEARDRWLPTSKLLPADQRTRSIAVRSENRYVRFVMRINVEGRTPHRTWPQVPRHLYASDQLARLDKLSMDYSQRLAARQPDLAPDATGTELDAQMNRIAGQLDYYEWVSDRIRVGLIAINGIKPFSDIK